MGGVGPGALRCLVEAVDGGWSDEAALCHRSREVGLRGAWRQRVWEAGEEGGGVVAGRGPYEGT